MDAKELRIGNWVDSGNGLQYQIKEFDFSRTIWEITKPIPLTSQILENCDFAQSFTSDPQEPDASQVFEIKYLSIHQHSEKENKFFFYNGDVEIEVLTLHQLQNLYFALCGQELNYNPHAK